MWWMNWWSMLVAILTVGLLVWLLYHWSWPRGRDGRRISIERAYELLDHWPKPVKNERLDHVREVALTVFVTIATVSEILHQRSNQSKSDRDPS